MTSKPLSSVAALAVLLAAACTNGSSPGETEPVGEPVPAAAPDEPAGAPEPMETPEAEPAAEPEEPAGTSDPARSADPTVEPRPTRVAASAGGPPLEQMALARPVGKIGAPVDVRYQLAGVVAKDQPATIELAFVPRVAGTNLRVEFPDTPGLSIDAGARLMQAQKAGAAEALRHSLLVTPTQSDTGQLRAIVWMDVGGGRYFTIYSIPIAAPSQATKQNAPKKN